MKKIFKIIMAFSLMLFSTALFADDWYVCLGSFKKLENAQNLVKALNNQDLPSFIYEHTTKSSPEPLYRILLDEPYATEAKVNVRRYEVAKMSAVKNLKITNVWYFQPKSENVVKSKQKFRTATSTATAASTAVPAETKTEVQVVTETKTVYAVTDENGNVIELLDENQMAERKAELEAKKAAEEKEAAEAEVKVEIPQNVEKENIVLEVPETEEFNEADFIEAVEPETEEPDEVPAAVEFQEEDIPEAEVFDESSEPDTQSEEEPQPVESDSSETDSEYTDEVHDMVNGVIDALVNDSLDSEEMETEEPEVYENDMSAADETDSESDEVSDEAEDWETEIEDEEEDNSDLEKVAAELEAEPTAPKSRLGGSSSDEEDDDDDLEEDEDSDEMEAPATDPYDESTVQISVTYPIPQSETDETEIPEENKYSEKGSR